MIPEAAVEAAARAMLAAGNHVGGWDALPTFLQRNYTRDARAALEAAAPHMLAGVWDEAIEAAARRKDDIEHAIYTGGTIPDDPITNPYRTTK